jgi:hypothetical protein
MCSVLTAREPFAAVGAQVHRFKEGDRAYALALVNPKGGFLR